jgi:catechol 2,3-dioxygenase-like lactoylglutathione lyase family enzyme
MKIVAIDHVQLAMPPGGEAAARRFYVGVLGFAEVLKPEAMRARGGAWFRSDAVAIHLGAEPGMRPSAKAHPALVVADLDAFARALVAGGCEWTEAHDGEPGARRGHTRDPFGNRIELIELSSDRV